MKYIERSIDLRKSHLTELPNLQDVIVEGSIYCNSNFLTTLKGSPEEVGGDFYCSGNKKFFTEAEVRAVCKVAGAIVNGIEGQGPL